jgi:hypothetical protein
MQGVFGRLIAYPTNGRTNMTRQFHRLTAAGVIAALAALVAAGPAGATAATATISAGSFALLSVPAVSFTGTLSGLDQTLTATQAIDVEDATGSGAGWNLTSTSTTFTTGAHSLSTSATTITSSPAEACDASATCATATNSVTYPYTLPAAGTAPTATKLFNAAVNTGMGDQTITPTWKLAVPANSFAGTYSSTWTISLVSAP